MECVQRVNRTHYSPTCPIHSQIFKNNLILNHSEHNLLIILLLNDQFGHSFFWDRRSQALLRCLTLGRIAA